MHPTEFHLHARLEDHHWWFRARREIVFTLLKQQLAPSPGKHILEIGCGTGGNLRLLSQHYSTMGIEIDPLRRESRGTAGRLSNSLRRSGHDLSAY